VPCPYDMLVMADRNVHPTIVPDKNVDLTNRLRCPRYLEARRALVACAKSIADSTTTQITVILSIGDAVKENRAANAAGRNVCRTTVRATS